MSKQTTMTPNMTVDRDIASKVESDTRDIEEASSNITHESSLTAIETSDQVQKGCSSLKEVPDGDANTVPKVDISKKVEGKEKEEDRSVGNGSILSTSNISGDKPTLIENYGSQKVETTTKELQNPNDTCLLRNRNVNETTANKYDDELLVPKEKIDAIVQKQDSMPSLSTEITGQKQVTTSKDVVSKVTTSENDDEVYISEVNKVMEGQGRAYAAYTIQYHGRSVQRRYSDFESLRNILVRLFPVRFIPPIPEKQTIKSLGQSIASNFNLNLSNRLSYSSLVSATNNEAVSNMSASVIDESISSGDEQLIRYRIRILTQFLRKVLQNEHIKQTNILGEFLDPNNVSWGNFVAGSGVLASLPSNILRCNPVDPTHIDSTYALLPLPSQVQNLLHTETTDPSNSTSGDSATGKDLIEPIELDFQRYRDTLDENFYKTTKDTINHLNSLSLEMKEVAATFANSASENNDNPELAENFAHYSDTYDESSHNIEILSTQLYYNFNEPLKGAVATANTAKKLLTFLRMKYIQREMIKRSLQSDKGYLNKLEEHIEKYKHVDYVIDQEAAQSNKINLTRPECEPEGYGGKFLKGLGKFATMVKESVSPSEVDPRVTAEKVKEHIQNLEKMLEMTNKDMDKVSEIVLNEELPKIRREREEELLVLLRCYSQYMRLYAQKNLEVWREIKWHQAEK